MAAARADLLRRAGRRDEAYSAYTKAIGCARNDREARALERQAQRVLVPTDAGNRDG